MERATGSTTVHSWYGLPGKIDVENELWHLVEVGGVQLPHPPLVNLMIRRGLSREDRLRFSYLHEFGHLQALPLTVLHALFLMRRAREGGLPAWLKLIAGLVAYEAAWEVAPESYVLLHARVNYHRAYEGRSNRWLGLFWWGMITLAVLGTWIIGYSSRSSIGAPQAR